MVAKPRRSASKIVPLLLFPLDEPSTAPIDTAQTAFSDPAFAQNKILPIHRWVPWIAGFSRDFVQNALRRFAPPRGVILDPFAGVGTTLIEASLAGYDAIGFEINPYAALASQMKAEAARMSVSQIRAEVARFQRFYQKCLTTDYMPLNASPAGFKTRAPFYSPDVLRKVLIVHDFLDTVNDANLQSLFRLAFAATMVRYSNYSYEPSLGRRVSSGKAEILDYPVGAAIADKLQEMADDIVWLQARDEPTGQHIQVNNESFFQYRQHLAPDSVDMIITSPPYLNNYHYNRNTRPHLFWLGYAQRPSDLKALEQGNFGQYWQTVCDGATVDLDFALPASDLAACIAEVRACNPHKGIYGGNGWANYAATYFNDCRRFAQGIQYALKPGGTALVVLGNSILQGVFMPTDRYFGEIAASVGLTLEGIEVPRATRVGNSLIQSNVRVGKAQAKHQLYEAIVILRKPYQHIICSQHGRTLNDISLLTKPAILSP